MKSCGFFVLLLVTYTLLATLATVRSWPWQSKLAGWLAGWLAMADRQRQIEKLPVNGGYLANIGRRQIILADDKEQDHLIHQHQSNQASCV